MVASLSRPDRIRQLKRELSSLERAGRGPLREKSLISTGIQALDEALPEGGFERGTLVEWLTAGEGAGTGMLALRGVPQAMRTGEAFVVIDPKSEFYPPAAAVWGIDLSRTILVRPTKAGDVMWALEQSLCTRGVAAVLCWTEQLPDRAFRRLQLAAETSGNLGLLIRPARVRRQPSWADVRLLVEPLPSPPSFCGWRLRVDVLRCRGEKQGGTVELELSDETGVVHLASQLVTATCTERTA